MLLLQQRMLEYLDLRRLPEEKARLLLRLTKDKISFRNKKHNLCLMVLVEQGETLGIL
jgi:hypothetical protein